MRINVLTLKFSVEIQNLVTGVHTFAYGTNWEINFVKDHSNFYLVIMYLILITFSLDSFTDTVRRNLILVTLGVLRVLCKSNLGCSQRVSQLVGMARIYIVRVNAKIRHRETGESWGFLDIHAFSILPLLWGLEEFKFRHAFLSIAKYWRAFLSIIVIPLLMCSIFGDPGTDSGGELCRFFSLPVQTFPRSHYLPLSLQGWKCPTSTRINKSTRFFHGLYSYIPYK